jgi:hypothetical protein
MDAVTYPNKKVIDFFEQYLAPVRVHITSEPLPQQFKVNWTPTLVILDSQGEEQHRTVGFLPPEQLIPSLMLGLAKSLLTRKDYSGALKFLDQVVADYSQSIVAPEAIYYQGVAHYRLSHDLKDMKRALDTLKSKFPTSEWVMRASVYEEV